MFPFLNVSIQNLRIIHFYVWTEAENAQVCMCLQTELDSPKGTWNRPLMIRSK